MFEIAAILACLILAGLTIFQVLLIAGFPLGRFAWGGAHTVLPNKLRIGSAVSIILYMIFAVLILERSGIISVINSNNVTGIAIWILAAYFLVGVFMNAISKSKPERMTMTPIALLLCILCVIVALQ